MIGQVQMDRGLIQADSKVKPKAPGMKYRHYAPKADLTVVEGSPEAVQEKICALVDEKIKAGEKVGVNRHRGEHAGLSGRNCKMHRNKGR